MVALPGYILPGKTNDMFIEKQKVVISTFQVKNKFCPKHRDS